jgi:hypothetical protein
MRKAPPGLGVLLGILAIVCGGPLRAQNARPFEDVKPDDWAYHAVTDMVTRGIITGYPDDHFNGQRTLTRYEFAVALKRALDRIPPPSRTVIRPSSKDPGKGGAGVSAPPPVMTSVDIDQMLRLVAAFKDELGTLGVSVTDAVAKLNGLNRTAADTAPRRPDPVGRFDGQFGIGSRPDGSRYGFLDYGGVARGAAPSLFDSRLRDGFELRTKLGSATTTLFGGSVGGGALGSSGSLLAGQPNAPSSASGFRATYPGIQLNGTGYAPSTGAYGVGAPFGSLNFADSAPGRLFGIRGDIPASRSAQFGVSLLDFSGPTDGILGGPAVAPLGGVTVYGANLRLSPSRSFAISGEASKSIAQGGLIDPDGNSDDTNAFLLNLAYNNGPVSGTAGYQYYDPSYAAPANWNKIGSWYNPTNVQGPFARFGYQFSDAVKADLGVDFLTGARNRPGIGGLTTGSNVLRALGGVKYHFSKQFALSADYEGVFYDLSGAVSASGVRARPIEQYITLGAGLNLNGNTVLRMAYQIINVQDPGNGFGAGAGGSGGAASTSVFTTQLAVHF